MVSLLVKMHPFLTRHILRDHGRDVKEKVYTRIPEPGTACLLNHAPFVEAKRKLREVPVFLMSVLK
jgi:hypothetical protein